MAKTLTFLGNSSSILCGHCCFPSSCSNYNLSCNVFAAISTYSYPLVASFHIKTTGLFCKIVFHVSSNYQFRFFISMHIISVAVQC